MALLNKVFGRAETLKVAIRGEEGRVQEIGREILQRARKHESGWLNAKFYSDKLVGFAMKDEDFKVRLFRFVDCFPMLKDPEAVYEHLADYLMRPGVKRPPGLEMAMKLGAISKRTVAATMASQIEGMARQFIAAETPAAAVEVLRKRWEEGIAATIDLLGEACVSDAEADEYQQRYLDVLGTLAGEMKRWPANQVLDRDHLGLVPRMNVSMKLTSLSARFNPQDPRGAMVDLEQRMGPVLQRARELGASVTIDIESYAYKDLTLEAFERLCGMTDGTVGLALQAYLRSGEEDALRVVRWAKQSGRVVPVRLVKGAYWDYETIHAELMGWDCPVWSTKPQTDACFERMTAILLEATPRKPGVGGVTLALGSHNVRSIAAALADCEKRGLPRSAVEVQMLYGMGDPLKEAGAEMGLRMREYVPLGQMIPGMAYLVRRLLENTSNESWLRAGFVDRADEQRLLASPHVQAADESPKAPKEHGLSPAVEGVAERKAFATESMRDFSLAKVRERFAAAIAKVPSAGAIARGGTEDVDGAIGVAQAALKGWREAEAVTRAQTLVKAAALMRQRRDELAAVVLVESGKTWGEADADVCEAIDFCEYYARQGAALMTPKRLGRYVGEQNTLMHQSRGVVGVISPWNFPMAICCGMTTAALVTGNCAVVKAAHQTPGIAKCLVDILHEAGVPREVVQLLSGPGSKVGAALVRDPRVAMVAFTGSREVGFGILEAAAKMGGAAEIKKLVLELGGKNALIVDASADLDEAVLGVRQSAFSYQGQKCSACSRAIVVDPTGGAGGVYETFLRRLAEATRALVIGDVREPGTQFGPVIDARAKQGIERYIEIGHKDGRCVLAMEIPAGLEEKTGRAYVGPHIFADLGAQSALVREEIFGPVLAVMRARSFEEALAMANDCDYRLTGGVFSRTPANLERAMREFRVGDLYLNRAITGALVGRQPFGGFGHSGVGSQAGGPEYLLQFVVPRVCCENTLRRGFAPAEQ